MSSMTGQGSTSSKAVSTPNLPPSPAAYQPIPPQRRPGGSGSFGAGSTSRQSSSRNNQPRKNQHKKHKRPSLTKDDVLAESVVMRSTTSRKGQTSITHLMNFALPPRPQYNASPSHRRGPRYPTWGLGSGYHAVDKARYVHANYRFIVNPLHRYHAQAANADVHLDWNSVLQVLASAKTQAANCPICLSTPVAARMAKCGHIFCFPCLIRYMHSTDEEHPMPEKKPRWKTCPICWDAIYLSDIRPVRWFQGNNHDLPVEGGDVVLRLIKRNPDSTLALPLEDAVELGPDEDVPWYHAAEVADYARIMKGGEDYMLAQYDAEIEDLKRQEQEDELYYGEDTTWIRKAINSIMEAKERVRGIGNPPDIVRVEKKPAREPIKFESSEQAPEMYTISRSVTPGQSLAADQHTSHQPGAPDVEKLSQKVADVKVHDSDSKRKAKNPTQSGPSNHPFYYYQALPHFYLSPLDIRILKAAWGDYSLFPTTILPRVEHISSGHIVDDDLRKRAKYLSHLPYGCEVHFLECDWTDVVPAEVLERFQTEINKRRQRNREKAAREEKARIRAEKEEEEQRWAAARRRRSSYEEAQERPFSDEDFLPLSGSQAGTSNSAAVDTDVPATTPPFQGSSRFGALASPSSSPQGQRTVWGTTVVAPSAPEPAPAPPVNDGWRQGWEEELLEQNQSVYNPASGSRKKKGKKITLLSTNIQRGA